MPPVAGIVAAAGIWAWALSAAISSAGAWPLPFRIAIAATILLVIVGITFSSMTIVVRDGEVAWWFGAGFPRAHLPLDRLADASAMRSTFWQGWGLHLTARGWLWNVRGLNGVRLRTTHGGGVLLGTDRPQELLDAIARARWAGAA